MSINASNLVMGPAILYVAPFGTAEPQDSAVTPTGYLTPPGAGWIDVGATDGGVAFEADSTYTPLVADQVTMDLGARLTEMKMSVTAKLSEMTLTNLNTALNNISSVGSGSGYSTLDIPVGLTSTQPTYAALCIYGWAPMLTTGYPALRRIIVRKVLSQTKVSMMFDKKTQASYDTTFSAYFVSSSLPPVHITDEDS